MSIFGKLEDVSVAEVMQFIALGARSGVLYLEGEAKAEVHFNLGRIVSARGDRTQRLGELLVDKGCIDRQTLIRAVELQSSGGHGRVLGEVLLSIGALSREALIQAVEEHIQETVFDVLHWRTGSFQFALQDVKPIHGFERSPGGLLPGVDLNTQMVLLEGARRSDEGRLVARRRFRTRAREALEAYQPPAARAAEAPQEAPKAQEHQAIDTLFDLTEFYEAGDDVARPHRAVLERGDLDAAHAVLSKLRVLSEEIRSGVLSMNAILVLMNVLAESLERAVSFLVRKDSLTAFGGFGFATHGEHSPVAEATRGLRLPFAGSDALVEALTYRRSRQVSFETDVMPRRLVGRIGAPSNGQGAVFPVVGSEQVLLLIYADNGTQPRPVQEMELIELVADQVGIAIENQLLRTRLSGQPGISNRAGPPS